MQGSPLFTKAQLSSGPYGRSVLLEPYISYFLPLLLSLHGFLCMETIAREYHRYNFIEMRIYIMRRNAMKQQEWALTKLGLVKNNSKINTQDSIWYLSV